MNDFKTVLASIDDVDHIQRIELRDAAGNLTDTIKNKPGKQGSLKVYYQLNKTFGGVTKEAAVEGVSLFAEHTQDAKDNPGKHPNIDRLFDVIENDAPLSIKVIEA